MKVVIKNCNEYDLDLVKSKIKESLDELGGLPSLIKPNDKVFIKLNCLGPFNQDLGITTHPVVLKAVIELVKEITPNISLGDNPAVRDQIQTMKKNGTYDVAVEENVRIIDTKEFKKIYNPTYKLYSEFEVSKEMLDNDVIINLPKLKTHSLAYITAAEKNLFGFIYGLNKSAWHVKANNPSIFGQVINDLYGAIKENYKDKPFISICDGIIALEGEGPSTGGKAKDAKVLLTSLDPVSLDRVAVEVMGLDFNKSYITKIAGERGYGETDLSKIEIVGDKLENKHFLEPHNALDNGKLAILKFKPLRNALLEHPTIDHNKCIKCGECTRICPPKTMVIEKGEYPHLKTLKCIRCWCCAEVCPQNAISKSKRPVLGKILLK